MDMLESLKHTFLMNFRTGNIIIDSILATIVLSLVSNMYIYTSTIKNFPFLVYNYYNNLNVNKISFNCTELSNQYSRGGKLKMHGSDAFKAIILDIRENIKLKNIVGLNSLREFCGDQDEYYWETENNSKCIDESIKDIIYLIDQDNEFSINTQNTQNLYFKMKAASQDENDGEDKKKIGKHTIYTLSICSQIESLEYIQNYINHTLDNYLNQVNSKVNNNQFIFMYEGVNSEKDIVFTTYPFHSTCNINNIYFEGKDETMKQINFFRDNKEWYEKYGKPYTLGICSYGKPGCGKTSFEKALAKYLNRHLIIVDLSKVNTQKEADQIFFSEKINGKQIPYDKRIYIFPDIDAMDSVVSRENNSTDKKIDEISKTIQNCRKKKLDDTDLLALLDFCDQPKIKEINPLNLSKMLNIIDGIPERTGQILIFCTNHPEKLDPALLRPGRVDCMIHFDKMSSENVLKMITNYLENDKYITKNFQKIVKELQKCNKFWTPAEVFQICSKYENTQTILSHIKNCKKKELQFI